MAEQESLRILRLQVDDLPTAARWDAFVRACPQATFFHLSAWQQVIRQSFRHDTYFLYAEQAGQIVGVLPMAHVASWLFGKSLTALPFAVYGGVAARDEAAANALEREAQALARSLGVSHLELRNSQRRHDDWPTQDLYVTFKLAIPPVLDEKMLCIPQKRRNMVRKAQKLGLRAVIDDSVDNFYPVFSHNSRDHGTPVIQKRYFEQVKQVFGRDCEILSVYSPAGKCISSIYCFYFRNEVLAYYAGETREAKSSAANDFKYWSLMQRAAQRGCDVFDLGRSKKGTGSFEFKRTWGFEQQQLYYQYDLIGGSAIPQNNPTNKKFKLFIEMWKRMPLPMTEMLGPIIVRNLG